MVVYFPCKLLYLIWNLLKPACGQTPPPISFLWPVLVMRYSHGAEQGQLWCLQGFFFSCECFVLVLLGLPSWGRTRRGKNIINKTFRILVEKGERVEHLAKGERRNFRKANFTLENSFAIGSPIHGSEAIVDFKWSTTKQNENKNENRKRKKNNKEERTREQESNYGKHGNKQIQKKHRKNVENETNNKKEQTNN